MSSSQSPLLQIKKAHVRFKDKDALQNVDFEIFPGQSVALIGESGSGKSALALYILQLLPKHASSTGQIIFNQQKIHQMPKAQQRLLIGREIGWIPQDPSTALNPSLKIETQLIEALRAHKKISKKDAIDKVMHLMELTQVPYPSLRLKQYPHQLSGGVKQRILIAMSLSMDPKLLIADEPTASLDSRAQIALIKLILNLQIKLNLSMLIISHNLGFVSKLCDITQVMYGGKIVEKGTTHSVFNNPLHPYTQSLIKAMPTLHTSDLQPIQGTIDERAFLADCCPFFPRCPKAMNICAQKQPPLFDVQSRVVPCFLYDPEKDKKKDKKDEKTSLSVKVNL